MVSSLSWRSSRVLEKNTRVVLRKLNKWIMMGIARANRAQRKDGDAKLINTKVTISGAWREYPSSQRVVLLSAVEVVGLTGITTRIIASQNWQTRYHDDYL